MTESALQDFCRGILECGDLAHKLVPPPAELLAGSERASLPSLCPVGPVRDPDLSLSNRAVRLPRPAALGDPAARASCLARFAHHELMAVELFAWALLRWPALPRALRGGWLSVLADEQQHCRLYVERLAAHGDTLADHPRSDYFWRHAGAIASSSHGPRAFLAAIGLTLEQANLDFTALYAEGFRAGGDPKSAAVCECVHADEVRHVRVAAVWQRHLATDPGTADVDAYLAAVPFPFGLHRAKGRRFDAEARRRAGLSERFIAAVRGARSSAGGR